MFNKITKSNSIYVPRKKPSKIIKNHIDDKRDTIREKKKNNTNQEI